MRVILFAFVILTSALAFPVSAKAQSAASEAAGGCALKELRRLDQEELKAILGQHKRWLALQPSMRDPNDKRRANLCNAMMLVALLDRADLRLANLRGAYLADAHLNGAYLWGADLEGANLTGAELNGVSLTRARLKRANLSQARLGCLNPGRPDERCADLREARLNEARLIEADLSGANLTKAKLERANLSGARLIGADLSGADLSGANLTGVNLSRANLTGARIDGAGLGSANLAGAIFEPVPAFSPADLEGARNLHLLRFVDSPEAILKLRQVFREAGLRDLERQITYAIKKSGRRQAKEKGGFDALAAGITHVLFEMTTEWGLAPQRALIILGFIGLISAVFYIQAVFVPLTAGGGLYRDWKNVEDRWEFEKHKWEIKNEDGDEPERNIDDEDEEEEEVPKEYDKEKWQAESENTRHWVEVRWYLALPWALYFSFLSALSLGYGKYKLSSLLHGFGPHKYELRMSGWVRGPSAVQMVVSSYLLAIWAVTLLGRPFG